ncbi:MAG: NADP-dependent phosphogluconate dehydrogenase [Candidatus Actinomarina sp.]|jgi:6-phosphogluconate dehydrogenase|nr:NADP-dependent phosphogluconate dehydrogenase [Candidatus Actinomarina sp.]
MLSEIGLIGLGVMGKNIALNIAEKGTFVKAFNGSREKIDVISEEFGGMFAGFTKLEELIDNLERPRNILLMIPSGQPTHSVINQLSNLLDEGDVIIDGGNSFYQESENHGNILSSKSIEFVGMGVSGGEEGARHGPAIMIGSANNLSDELVELLTAISAKAPNDCIGLYKGHGSGHFIKMVHNGIEYAEMQLITEAYYLLKYAEYSNIEIAEFFESLKGMNQSSYLIEITSEILRKKDGEVFTLDLIKPFANNKGTGKLTIETSFELGISAPSIYAAYDARVQSNAADTWKKTANQNEDTMLEVDYSFNKVINESNLSKALYFGRVAAMVQGLKIIHKYSEVNDLSINYSDIFNNWSGGCIIRSQMLDELLEINKTAEDFLKSESLHNLLKDNLSVVKDVVSSSILNNISLPVLSSSLSWYLNLSSDSNPSNLIQAQRDYFGSHTVQLLDSEEYIHIDWRENE